MTAAQREHTPNQRRTPKRWATTPGKTKRRAGHNAGQKNAGRKTPGKTHTPMTTPDKQRRARQTPGKNAGQDTHADDRRNNTPGKTHTPMTAGQNAGQDTHADDRRRGTPETQRRARHTRRDGNAGKTPGKTHTPMTAAHERNAERRRAKETPGKTHTPMTTAPSATPRTPETPGKTHTPMTAGAQRNAEDAEKHAWQDTHAEGDKHAGQDRENEQDHATTATGSRAECVISRDGSLSCRAPGKTHNILSCSSAIEGRGLGVVVTSDLHRLFLFFSNSVVCVSWRVDLRVTCRKVPLW